MPDASPMRAITHWRVLSAMFITKRLRQGHLARGVGKLEPAAVVQGPDPGGPGAR